MARRAQVKAEMGSDGTRVVDNPLVTDAIGEARPDFLKITVTENVRTRIGGLAYIRPFNAKTGKGKRRLHHEQTAERFLNLYERRYGRTSPAVDPAREPVDTSIMAHDSGMAAALDATNEIRALEHPWLRGGVIQPAVFHENEFRFLVAVLCLGMNIGHFTETAGRALDREVDRFLSLLDKLSVHWGLSMEAA